MSESYTKYQVTLIARDNHFQTIVQNTKTLDQLGDRDGTVFNADLGSSKTDGELFLFEAGLLALYQVVPSARNEVIDERMIFNAWGTTVMEFEAKDPEPKGWKATFLSSTNREFIAYEAELAVNNQSMLEYIQYCTNLDSKLIKLQLI